MNANQRKQQQGFTLIELMIVVAIIGVLSAIAVPAYKNYVSKSELASGFATLKSLVTPAELYIQENGSLSGATSSTFGVVSGGTNSIGSVNVDPTNKKLTFSFSNSSIDGTTIDYNRSSGAWICTVTFASGITLDKPKSCS
ncbi:pilin [Vibrio fluvialis]|jgi:type IV pilus assembly protein PilA|uniref:Type IV pilin PilA n=1 Tax=Vibrio fluvialis PG41 TaxID=1336752 RepID=S7HVZ5_VIBFL|nr:pilin [Vibrio fluvialis]AVH32131.1 pilin [Vibrio fluvialis]EKO3486966.1 pilin [Vibrio fluvialis]EKO3967161.1 pilin [Vibrio fluvialis]ELI5732650.1 pilin [Vibrio fluvialis]EPP19833.1 Type IV pilin PilA [Vibrio fluvialis PG41]